MSNTLEEFTLQITVDINQLRTQKFFLSTIDPEELTLDQKESLDGLLSMCDYIQDTAVQNGFSEGDVFITPDGE